MKNKKILLLMICAVLLLLVAGLVIGRVLPTNVSISDFEKDDMFQFRSYRYGMSQSGVKLRWSGALELHDLGRQEALYSGTTARLNGKEAAVNFNFRDGELVLVAFNVEDCDDAWFRSLVEEVRSLYGKEDQSAKEQVYRWNQNGTTLVVQLFSNNQITLMVSLEGV